MGTLEKYAEGIAALCKQHKVEHLYAIGSVLTPEFQESSDIDFLVRFGKVEPELYFDNFMELKEKLEQLFTRPVDLIEEQTVKNPVLQRSIDRNKKLVYGGAGRKVAA